MTEKANPSINRPAEAFKTAGAIGYGGHSEGYVVPSASPTEISQQDGGITEGNLNAFAETSSGASLSVDIDGGEAFVFGSWLAIDTVTSVGLSSSTADQTVYVGWNKGGSDDVIVGLDSAFANASGDTDMKIPLWDFDTDGSGVTAVDDRRRLGKTVDGSVQYDTSLQSGAYTTTGEGIIFVDTTSSPVTITLSDADAKDGREITIVDAGGNAGTNVITIDTESSQTIDGANTDTIGSDYGANRIVSDGTDWFTSGGGGGGATEVDLGTITLSTGSTPAFDGTLNAVTTSETGRIEDVVVHIESSGQVASDYAFNHDWGQRWDNTNTEVDANLTVNWDNDPGSNLTARVVGVLR